MTGLLSASTLPAPAVKKTSILSEAYLDSPPESSLCISKKPHKLPSLLCQSHLHSLTRFSSESFIVQPTSKIHRNDKCCCARYSPWDDKKNLWQAWSLLHKTLYQTKAFVSEISLYASLCQYACSSVKVNWVQGAETWVSGTTGSKEVLFSVESGK